MSNETSTFRGSVREGYVNIRMRRVAKKLASQMLAAARGYEEVHATAHHDQSRIHFLQSESGVSAELTFRGQTGYSTEARIEAELPNYGYDNPRLTVTTGPDLKRPETLTVFHHPPLEGEAMLPTGDTKLALHALQTNLSELAKTHSPAISEAHYAPYAPNTPN